MKYGLLGLLALTLTACTSYQASDYGADSTLSQDRMEQASCANLPPAQKDMCLKRQKKLTLSLINSGNCKSEYEYQKNHCLKQKELKDKQLKDALKKHIDK